ncbi:hypothetical protein C8R43DRAFT_244116 [Mycena crocata]|nr:hypothetical protein C8R43DRAFT_244116 [Mycena crocata]
MKLGHGNFRSGCHPKNLAMSAFCFDVGGCLFPMTRKSGEGGRQSPDICVLTPKCRHDHQDKINMGTLVFSSITQDQLPCCFIPLITACRRMFWVQELEKKPPHVPTNIWACFRARLAHYLGQQREILVVANQSRQPFPIPSMSGVAGLPYEFPNDAFEHGGFIDFTEGRSRYVFQYSFIHALPIQAWESLVWKICASTSSVCSSQVST